MFVAQGFRFGPQDFGLGVWGLGFRLRRICTSISVDIHLGVAIEHVVR